MSSCCSDILEIGYKKSKNMELLPVSWEAVAYSCNISNCLSEIRYMYYKKNNFIAKFT